MTQKTARWILLAGIVLMLPSACSVAMDSGSSANDASVAFTPITRLSLDSLRGGSVVQLLFVVPDTAQWARIHKSLGDLGYIALAATRRQDKLIPFGSLDLQLDVVGRNGRVLLERTGQTPYRYSSDTTDVGIRFKPAARDEVRIRITAHRPERLPEGELIIEPYWDWNAKDFLVGAYLDRAIRPIIVRADQVGIVLLIVGTIFLIFLVFRRPSNTALEPSAR